MDPAMHHTLISRVSTNLHNLSHGRFGTLVGSAFVVDAGPVYLWLPGLVCLLLAAELMWGGVRLVIAFAAGHVGATLLVAAGLAAAVKLGWLSRSIARASDVGMSYGAMAVVGVLTAAIPSRWRPAWLGWGLAAAAAILAGGGGFTDVGHVVALALGMLMSPRFGERAQWTVPRVILLVLGAAFGYLVLADGVVPMVYGAAWGALGALTFSGFARLAAGMAPVVADAASAANSTSPPAGGPPRLGIRDWNRGQAHGPHS
jgi:hypothetical protein